jgi:hypothetical protein
MQFVTSVMKDAFLNLRNRRAGKLIFLGSNEVTRDGEQYGAARSWINLRFEKDSVKLENTR